MKKEKIYEWIATFLSIIGAILNAFLIKEGFYIWGLSNILWVIVGIKNKMWGMVLTFSIYFIINVIGIIYW
ncbi:MAG: nicotinamide mononucleotide transporter [Candidatus Nanoarchaeia archaeon]|nr:nicotinamide mononucleotide transporter [Candidatus Nanoarchaeia archaeon]